MKKIISIILALTLFMSFSVVSFAKESPNTEKEAIVPFSSIEDIEHTMSELENIKIKQKSSKNKAEFDKTILELESNLEKKGAKILKKSDKEFQNMLKFFNKRKDLPENFDLPSYSIYVVNTEYNPQQTNKSNLMMATSSSYPGWRMQLVYINSSNEASYMKTYDASSIDLADSSLTTREFADRAIDVVVGSTSPWVWIPKTLFGLNLDSILPDEIVNSVGKTYFLNGGGKFTKKYVRFLDTDSKYNGGYITGAVVNMAETVTNHTFMYYDPATDKIVNNIEPNDMRTIKHDYYDSQIYDIAWNNYLNYYPMGHYTIKDVKFKTVDGAVTALLKQEWDVWDSYYDNF